MMKLWVALLAGGWVSFAQSQDPLPAKPKVTVSTTLQVAVDGSPVVFSGTKPQRVKGRVLIPLRGVLEKLGATVGWDANVKTVTAYKEGVDLSMRIGQSEAVVNSKIIPLDVPAMIIGGSTMVPIRFVAEALGAEVVYGGPPVGNGSVVGTWFLLDSDGKFVGNTKIRFSDKGEFFFIGSAWRSEGKYTRTTEGVDLVWTKVDNEAVAAGSMKKSLPVSENATRMQLDRFTYGKYN